MQQSFEINLQLSTKSLFYTVKEKLNMQEFLEGLHDNKELSFSKIIEEREVIE